MYDYHKIKEDIRDMGFALVDAVYTDAEADRLIEQIEAADPSGPEFRSTKDLFAIRNFLTAVPGISGFVFNDALKRLVQQTFGTGYFVIKSIYFDKPQQSNWFVAYHQDLMIGVSQKAALDGFGPWTIKPGQIAVQPPVPVLEDIFTIRIHLDKTDEHNGALKVVPGSHRKKIYRPETINWKEEQEIVCPLERGGVMIMKPLLLHASGRSTNNHKRRVIHIEFSKTLLPEPLQWSEFRAVGGL